MQSDRVREDFISIMRRIAATVTIVTARDLQRRHGMTATAFTSLSMSPASLLVCINKRTLLHAMLMEGSLFCVNVLSEAQAQHSSAFSGGAAWDRRFDTGDWIEEPDAPPYLADAQANIFCTRDAAIPYATHTIFIGIVVRTRSNGTAPLLYHDTGYCAVGQVDAARAQRPLSPEPSALSVGDRA